MRLIKIPFLFLFPLLVGLSVPQSAWATHAATANGEIEGRPAPVFRRVCLAGTQAGSYCKQDSECPGSACAQKNIFNITVAVRFNANANQLTSIQDLITAMSGVLLDVTDGQAEIGTATIHNDAISTAQADLVIHPATNDTWWQANSGHYRTGGFMEVSINYIGNPANQGAILAHEFSHLVFDARDEYESRLPNCGDLDGGANCPVPGSGVARGLMDNNGTELCWGQGNPADVTDLSGGDHDPTNVTEQSSCRNNRSVWDQLVWAWPSTFLMPAGAPDPGSNGVAANPPNFVITNDSVRVVLVLDESNSMSSESPTRMQRLQVAASDFIATAENGTEVGIVSYSNDAEQANGHASVPIDALGANRSNWNTAISNLTPGGWTNIGDGLQKAKDMIVAAGGVTANTYIVLMTDGRNNRPEPQATADADLQAKIDDLLMSGIPVYVTCTGGDLGLQSQCAEIAAGTNGFNSDSADAAKLPETFVDFHERITGYQVIDSEYGNFAKLEASSPRVFYVDDGSRSASFSLLWEESNTRASMSMIAPDGTTFQSRSIPQGAYVRIANPLPGEWTMRIDPSGRSSSDFVARGYVNNRINSLSLALRHNSVQINSEIYVYAIARSLGGMVTKQDQVIHGLVALPDGSVRPIELRDSGRDAMGHGDDLAGDGIFTGVFTDTSQKGAYGFKVDAEVDEWIPGKDAHMVEPDRISPRFIREVSVSAGVFDPNDVETTPEDTPRNEEETDDKELDQVRVLIYITIVLLVVTILLIWLCCCKRKLG